MSDLIRILFVGLASAVVVACGSDEEAVVPGDTGTDASEDVTEADGSGVDDLDVIGTTDADALDDDALLTDAEGSGDIPDASVDAIELDGSGDGDVTDVVRCTSDDDCADGEYCDTQAEGSGEFQDPDLGTCQPLPPIPDPEPAPDAGNED